MPYTKLTEENVKKINKLFGVVRVEDLSQKERDIREYFANTTMEEELNKISRWNSQIIDYTNNPNLFFDLELKNNEEEALAIQNTINAAKKKYDAKQATYESTTKKLEEAKKAYDDAGKVLHAAKEKQDSDLAKLKANYEKKVAEINNKGKQQKDAAEVMLSKKATLEAMHRAEMEYLNLDLERKVKQLEGLYSSLSRHSNDEKTEAYKKLIDKTTKEVVSLRKKLVDPSKKQQKIVQNKEEALKKIEMIEDDKKKKLVAAEKEYNEAVQKIQNSTKDAEASYHAASAAYTKADKVNDLAKKDMGEATKDYNAALNSKKTYAKGYCDYLKNKKAVLEEKITQYNKIERALANHNPIVTKTAVAKGLALVNQAYKTYCSQHSKVARFFAILGIGSATGDRSNYKSVRNAFMQNSGVSKACVNKYLDDGVLTGALATQCEGKQDILNAPVYTCLGHNFEMVGNNTERYVAEMTQYFNTEIIPANENYVDRKTNIALEEGLHFLNALGDQKRLHPEMNTDDLVKHCKGIMMGISSSASRQQFIEAEITNALLPVEERKEIEPVGMPEKDLKNMMVIRAAVKDSMENNNMILGNDVFSEQVEIHENEQEDVVPMNNNPEPKKNLVIVAA